MRSPGAQLLHHSQHENGGIDELNVGGLSGLLGDPQTPLSHTHSGGDIISAVSEAINADTVDYKHVGTSGNTIPLLDGANTWSGGNIFGGPSHPITINQIKNTSAIKCDSAIAFTSGPANVQAYSYAPTLTGTCTSGNFYLLNFAPTIDLVTTSGYGIRAMQLAANVLGEIQGASNNDINGAVIGMRVDSLFTGVGDPNLQLAGSYQIAQWNLSVNKPGGTLYASVYGSRNEVAIDDGLYVDGAIYGNVYGTNSFIQSNLGQSGLDIEWDPKFFGYRSELMLWDYTPTGKTNNAYNFYISPDGYSGSDNGTVNFWGFYNDSSTDYKAHNLLGGDNVKTYFGTGLDASVYYDGTNLVVNPKEVGSGIVSVLGATKINVNSATAFFVEQDGVKDNVFIIDTTNGSIGMGIAPSSLNVLTINQEAGRPAIGITNTVTASGASSVRGLSYSPQIEGSYSSLNLTGISMVPTLLGSTSGATTVRALDLYFQTGQTLSSTASVSYTGSVIGVINASGFEGTSNQTIYQEGLNVTSVLNAYVDKASGTIATTTIGLNLWTQITDSSHLKGAYTGNMKAINNFVYGLLGEAFAEVECTWTPIFYCFYSDPHISDSRAASYTLNVYDLYIAQGDMYTANGTINRWGYYNDATTAHNLLGKDNVKSYFGTDKDAYICHNGTDLVIFPQNLGTGKVQIQGAYTSLFINPSGTAFGTNYPVISSSGPGGYTVIEGGVIMKEPTASDPVWLYFVSNDENTYHTITPWDNVTSSISDCLHYSTKTGLHKFEKVDTGDLGIVQAKQFNISSDGSYRVQLVATTGTSDKTITFPNATGNVPLLETANVFTNTNKINVNSTTAFFVEQDGVKDNVFIVDTTNGRVGINKAPTCALDISYFGTTAFTQGLNLSNSNSKSTVGSTGAHIAHYTDATLSNSGVMNYWQYAIQAGLDTSDSFIGSDNNVACYRGAQFGVSNENDYADSAEWCNSDSVGLVAYAHSDLYYHGTGYCYTKTVAGWFEAMTGMNMDQSSGRLALDTVGVYSWVSVSDVNYVASPVGELYITVKAFEALVQCPVDPYGIGLLYDAIPLAYGLYMAMSVGDNRSSPVGYEAYGVYIEGLGSSLDYSYLSKCYAFKADGGDLALTRDNSKILLGGGEDSSIYYDGTNLLIKPDVVGTGYLNIATGQSLAVVIGSGTAGVDYQIKFDGETNDGIVTWKEDEDYFQFSDDIALSNGEFLIFDKASGNGIKVDTASPTWSWRDVTGRLQTRGVGVSDPDWTLYRSPVYQYKFSDGHEHEAWLEFHIPHDYVPGTDLYIHVHWSQIVVDTGGAAGVPGVVEWAFDVSYADGHGTAGGVADPFAAPKIVSVTQQGSTTQYGHMVAEVAFTNAGGDATHFDRATILPDGVVLVRVHRDSTHVNDTLNQEPFLHYVDLHYQSSNIGTKAKVPNFYT